MKIRIPFHHDKITLNLKIAVLLVGTVSMSLGLAGWMVYKAMRKSTFDHYSDALAQIATVGGLAFAEEDRQAMVRGLPPGSPAYKRVRTQLARIWKQNRFDKPGRLGRVALLRLEKKTGILTPLVSLEQGSITPRPAQPKVWEAAARGAAATQTLDALDGDWISAWAAIPGTRGEDSVVLLKAEYSTSVVAYQLLKNMGSIVMACLLGLFVSLAGALLVSRQITQPLRAFTDVMMLMHETGNFNMRIDLHPDDRDMKVLEQTFINLMKKVRTSQVKVEQSYMSTLKALVTALDIRDNETSGHSLRVMRYAGLMADRLRVSDGTREEVERGALLHDIGKIGVPDAILRKNGRLTDIEWEEMKKHPEIGRQLVAGIDFLEPAIPVVHCHHERWDGQGYPRGLQGEEIPLAARIFMVADALDTITSERYYKRASSFEVARKEIERSRGTHFDPKVVESFLTIPIKTLRRVRSDSFPKLDKELTNPQAAA